VYAFHGDICIFIHITHTLLWYLLMRLQYGAPPAYWAIGKGSDTIMEILVEAGANVNAVDKVGVMFPACVCVPRRLCILIHGTHTVLCNLLMRLQDGVTLVHLAVDKGHSKIVEIMVKAGADVNVADKVGVMFPAKCCVCVPRRLCILIHGTHTVL
jgi:hypothetical protein